MRGLPKHNKVPLTLRLSGGMSQPSGVGNISSCPSWRGRLSHVPPCQKVIDALDSRGGQRARHSPAGLIHSTNSPEMHDIELGYTYQGGLSRQRWPSRCDFLANDALHSEVDRARATALRPSDTAWLNSSPGSRKRTAASICRNGTPLRLALLQRD